MFALHTTRFSSFLFLSLLQIQYFLLYYLQVQWLFSLITPNSEFLQWGVLCLFCFVFILAFCQLQIFFWLPLWLSKSLPIFPFYSDKALMTLHYLLVPQTFKTVVLNSFPNIRPTIICFSGIAFVGGIPIWFFSCLLLCMPCTLLLKTRCLNPIVWKFSKSDFPDA